jgi:hypothetical protein
LSGIVGSVLRALQLKEGASSPSDRNHIREIVAAAAELSVAGWRPWLGAAGYAVI